MAKYFEGKVQIKKMITEKLTKDFEVYLIIFEYGARTKLHYHEFEQVLIAVEGKGIVALQTGINQTGDNIGLIKIDEIHYLDEGDFVCIPPFKWHWHGAQKGGKFSHYQIKKPAGTIWAE
jgi:quercetin dioxygenase-like cupin family protein